MRLLQSLKRAISSIDMFYSSEMLRYETDTQYKTITGGIITISIVAMVTIGFASMIADTLNRTAITSTLNIRKSNDPTYYELKAEVQSMFMFGVMLQPIDVEFIVDLANGPRYFDISMILYHLKDGEIYQARDVPLVACTDEHWSPLPDVVAKKHVYQYQKWLCPQLGQAVPIQGSYTSADLYEASIFARPCSNSSAESRPCMPQSAIDQLMRNKTNFYLSLQYINPVINPNQPNYISYYLEGNDYVIFSATQGSEAWFFFSDYQITTDSSIFPFSQNTAETGVLVQYKAVNHPYTVSDYTGYANLYLAKSSNSLKYVRSVQKISAVFSYIGGLVGALTAVLFLLKTYTATSLELGIAIDLFHQSIQAEAPHKLVKRGKRLSFEKESEVKQELNFNILSFFSLTAYRLLNYFNLGGCFKKAQLLTQFKGEILHQLDIKTLLKRVISLQNCIGYLFQKHQLDGLKYHKKLDLVKARFLREQLVPPQVEVEPHAPDDQVQEQTVEDSKLSEIAKNLQFKFQKKKKLQSETILQPRNSHQSSNLSNLDYKLPGILKDEVIQHSAKECSSIDEPRQTQNIFFPRSTVKVSKEKVVTCQTLANLQQLRRQAQIDEFSQKIWSNVDESIKNYIQTVNREQQLGAGKKISASECSIDIKARKKHGTIRSFGDD